MHTAHGIGMVFFQLGVCNLGAIGFGGGGGLLDVISASSFLGFKDK